MRLRPRQQRRRGSILPLVVGSLVAMCGFVALAVDIGLIALAKTQAQNAADAGAMAGARALDGTPGQNLGSVGAKNTAKDLCLTTTQANKVLGDVLAQNSPQSKITMDFGAWHYDTTAQLFTPQFPPVSPDNYNLCQVTVSYNVNTTFAGAFAKIDPSFSSTFNVQAISQAAHRPRDVCIVLDYSGSMNNESDLWNNESYLDNGKINKTNGYTWPQPNNPNYTSNNIETVYPLFGHYQGSSGTAKSNNGNDYADYTQNPNLLSPTADSTSPLSGSTLIGKSNVSTDLTTTLGIPALVKDFYSNSRGGSVTYPFSSWPDSYANGTDTNQGDWYLPKKGTSTTPPTWAQTVADITGGTGYDTTFETKGYKGYYTGGKTFNGYIAGPRYWGKTFFVWPPDPTNDWRSKFFFNSDGVTPLKDNTKYFQNSYPGYKDPPGNYVINYKAILAWIANTGPNPFSTQLRSGNILYYSSIPTDVPAAAYIHTNTNVSIAWSSDAQRFWKEYIDWTLGVWRDPNGNIQHTQQPSCSIGPDYWWGSVQISAPPTGVSNVPYMNYSDNPWRPRHRMWFGAMTMIQFMSDTGLLSGVTHDISMFPMKQGVGGALLDIQNNHPNDLVAMLLFSRPQYDNDAPGTGTFNNPQYSLTNNYTAMLTSLWVPPNSGTTDVTPWDSNGQQTPHAHGDYDSNTASSYGFMLAYNQFSSNTALRTAGPASTPVGGLGRKGATRMVIYETDGMANADSQPLLGFVQGANGGAYNSYYAIRPGDVVNGAGYSQSNLLQVVETICNKDDSTYSYTVPSGAPTPPSNPGYATVNKPVIVHCIAFGAIFETPSSIQTSAVTLLQSISTLGGTTFPSSSADPVNGFKWCTGTLQQRQDKLKQAFLNILDSSVPVSVIK